MTISITLLLKCIIVLYIVYTGSDQPTMKDLQRHVVKQAAHKWRQIGESLKLEYYEMKMIATQYPSHVVRCFMGVVETWLINTPDASWNQLISALRSPTVRLHRLADQLEEMLSTECKIYSNSYSFLQTVHYEYRDYCGQSNHDS